MLPRRPLALLCALAAAAPIAATVTVRDARPPSRVLAASDLGGPGYAVASSDAPVLLRLRARERRRVVLSARARGHAHGRRGNPAGHGHPRAHVVVQRTRRPVPGLAAWLAAPETRKIRRCESDGDYALIDVNGGVPYRGAWQMDPDFLRTYAGISPSAYDRHGRFTLSRSAQDAAAYAGYLARGYEPWSCR